MGKPPNHQQPLELRPREFTQERARRTYEALLEAALRVFSDKGYEAAQTPDIAAAAGVSVGSFYRYFRDKRQIFLEVMQLHLQRLQQRVLSQLSVAELAGARRRATIEHALEVLLEQVNSAPGLHRVFLSMALRDAEVARLRGHVEAMAVAQLGRLIEAFAVPGETVDAEAVAFVIYTAAVECAVSVAGLRGEPSLSAPRAMAALTTLVCRALFGTADER